MPYIFRIFRRDRHVRSRIEEQYGILERQNRPDSRPQNAFDLADNQRRPRKERTRVAGGNERVALSLGKHPQSDRHRAVPLGTNHRQRVILHRHVRFCVHDVKAADIQSRFRRDLFDPTAVADHDIGRRPLLRRHANAFDSGFRAVISTHYINNYSHRLGPLYTVRLCECRQRPLR